MTAADRVKTIQEFLISEGYRPEVSGCYIALKHEGRRYYVAIDEENDQHYSIVFPSFWPIESDEERARALAAANKATGELKVAKVYVHDTDVWATLEAFCACPEHYLPVLLREIRAVSAAVRAFALAMEEG